MTPTLPAIRKATFFTTCITVVGAIVAMRSPTPLVYLLPCCILYAGLVINTFPSVRLFSSLHPDRDTMQTMIDTALVVLYICIALTLGHPLRFAALDTCLFVMAMIKYIYLLPQAAHRDLLRRKIFVDGLGAISAAVAFVGCLLWRSDIMMWLWAAAFTATQIDIFILHPLYVFPINERRGTSSSPDDGRAPPKRS